MSYDDKIRELMRRLAAMTPEPPPYPEDAPLASRRDASKSMRPVWAFAAAVAVVALLAVPLLLFNGDGNPVLSPSSTTTSVPATSTTRADVTTTTEEVLETWNGVVFFHQAPQDSFKEDPALVAVPLEVIGPASVLAPADEFTDVLGMVQPSLPSAFSNSIPPDVAVISTRADGGIIIVDMNEAFLAGAGGLLADTTMLNQLIYTITYGEDTETSVLFTVAGEPVTAFGSEGIDLTTPVNRETFQDSLGLIYLTEPLVETDGVYLVAGLANTFEASLAVRVVDSTGATIHEEHVMASEGSGVWGDFSAELDADLITPGETSIQLLTYSAEDGSETEVITIPIPPAVTWEFSIGD